VELTRSLLHAMAKTCPICKEERASTEWKPDPLKWEIKPEVNEDEWNFIAGCAGAPEYMARPFALSMNNICRGCYNDRCIILMKVREKIRELGGLEEMGPGKTERKRYEAEHKSDLLRNRAARIHGLTSEAGKALNGKFCMLQRQDEETKRWTVEMIDGTTKALKPENLEASKEIDGDFMLEKMKAVRDNPEVMKSMFANITKNSEATNQQRPVGKATAWPKVKGIHPGAVIRIKGLTGATELNGRKGRCISFDQENGRWKIDLGNGYKNIKIENLVPAPTEKPPTKASAEAEEKEFETNESRRAKMTDSERAAEDYGWEG